jgi:TonB family protein
VLGHAAAALYIKVRGIIGAPTEVQAQTPLTFACETDAALVTAARMSVCATPFAERSGCFDNALKEYDLDQTRCQAVEISAIDELDLAPLVPFAKPMEDKEAAKLIEEKVAEKLEEQQKRIENPKPMGQIVEITKPTMEKAPDKARFLSEFDSATQKETVARGSTQKMVERPSTAAAETPREAGTIGPQPQAPEKSVLSMRGPGANDALSALNPGALDGADTIDPEGFLPQKGDGITDPDKKPPGGQNEPGAPHTLDLKPSSEFMAKAVGGGSVDKLDGVESGDMTSLNSKQWKYASFFNRMKRQVAQNWHPDHVYMRRDPSGKVYGTKDRLTVLQVSLHPDGRLADVIVQEKSGISFLDEEAIRAFQLAQPFPNPPKALVDENGLITFQFGFYFEIGDRNSWKIFKTR